ncbi:MAG: response regulator [Pseudomonadota bacterium]
MPEADNGDLNMLAGMSILLAEDNVTNQLVATQMLKTLGAEVDIASDGAIALERVADQVYDVLLVDIEMPRVSGLDVIRAIRASDEPLASAPVIALTAYAMQEHREKIQRVGADGLIPKPITSIRQFGVDILKIVEERRSKQNTAGQSDAAEAAPEEAVERPAELDREIYDNLATSIGPDAMQELMVKVEADLRSIREEIQTAHANKDPKMMRGATHILISISGAIGGVRLQRHAEHLNQLANETSDVDMSYLAQEALRELDALIEFVTREIATMTAR